ncbi:Cysteine and histidine-rich domain-containing protein [Eumeta japonica]|uniref:Cysteine and histidine-rich domain-containing protein n=1 Tax=Eumeta variegata TaxID=151549 RepID=A0A4C1WBD2_EUMVA|nr:Cysteine and histidine-rich domain-containing protein [Eumeta japonica]
MQKPPEPEKKQAENTIDKEIIVIRPPIISPQLSRPPIETEMVVIMPNIAESLKNLVQTTSQKVEDTLDDGTVEIGTSCKNGGCNISYQGPQTNDSQCVYHPGCPVFHEGLKFWSCCQKRTTDFNVFLSQPGCTTGIHRWKKENTPSGTVKCRWDWHQTPEYVIVSVYAKKYDPTKSYIKMNPVRLNTKLVFPEEGDATFELDMELRGIVCVEKSSATMTPSKVEIKMKKAEPGAWSKLDFPRTESKKEPATSQDTKSQDDDDDLVDLSSVEAITSIGKVNITECTE